LKVSPAQAKRFVENPDPAIRAVLVYGPDEGLVRERIRALTLTVVEDIDDPFRVAEIDASILRNDPARLTDEAAALALTGGRRVVKLLRPEDNLAHIFKAFFEETPGDALILVDGGDLPARSALRKVFEGARAGAALACYHDEARDLTNVIRETLAAADLAGAPDALTYLSANLGGDRQLTRRELEKLIVYMGPPEQSGRATAERRVELEDVQACVGDSRDLAVDDITFAVADGDLPGLERSLTRSLQEGAQAISVLRAVARHFHRLHLIAGLLHRGVRTEDALKKLRPPVFWKTADRFKRQVGRWSVPALANALDSLLATEIACKRTGAPADTLVSRTLLQINANAPRRQIQRSR
jgi:DNA polymerase-3 subunit delta